MRTFLVIALFALVCACVVSCATVGYRGAPYVGPLPEGVTSQLQETAKTYPDMVSSGSQRPQLAAGGGEEIWVIAKAKHREGEEPADLPGTGQLAASQIRDGKQQLIPVPLKHTDVKASVAGYISSTTVKQQFTNPFASKIEAVYVFPLPENAAVNEFVMTIGERRIRGIIRERDEAQRIYDEAKSQGYVASLLTQERPNVFTQSVVNIEPDQQIDVEITYYHTLTYADGWYEWVFPMVVGPRYNPAGYSAGVGAAARNQPGSTGQKTEVQYLKPSERSGSDINLSLELNSPVALEDIACTSHRIDIARPTPQRAVISIAAADTLPNKDFVFRYRVAGNVIKTGMMVHRDQKGSYFSLMVYPPLQLSAQQRGPMEMVFLVDVSGSMSGEPIAQSKAAVRYALSHLDLRDTFQVITFSGSNRALFDRAQPVTRGNVDRAMLFVDHADAGGGTEMLPAIKAALAAPQDPEHRRIVTFLTDGYVGSEDQILLAVHESPGQARIFALGVGSSPNRYLMDGLARVGQGAVAYLGLHDSGEEVMKTYFDRIAHPAMTDIKVDFGDGMHVSDLFPTRKSDLFVGRPIAQSGRFSGEVPAAVQLHGNVSGSDVVIAVPVDREHKSNPVLAAIWARQKITDLSDEMFYAPSRIADLTVAIRQTALEYGMMSQFTAFIAVDSSRQTAGREGTTVTQPVPVPEGVKYETAVKE